MIAKQKPTCLMLLTLALFGVEGAAYNRLLAADDKPADVREKLIGVWKITALVENGKSTPVKDGSVIFTKEKLFIKIGDTVNGMAYTVDTGKTPVTIDLMPIGPADSESKPMMGIVQLKDSDLQLCFPTGGPDAERPKEFVSKENSRVSLITLKRDTKAKPVEAKEIAELEMQVLRPHSANNLKRIGLAFLAYHDTHGSFPTAAIMSNDGKPLLSWRVALLPYLEADELYRQFKLDEPWDSAHNMKLLAKMPRLYAPVGVKTKEPHTTFYQTFVGKDTVLTFPLTMATITDGTANTALVVEAGKPVPWTKPEDLPYDADKPLPELGGPFKGDFHILMANGSVGFVRKKIDEKILRLLITATDGMAIDEKVLESFQLRSYKQKD